MVLQIAELRSEGLQAVSFQSPQRRAWHALKNLGGKVSRPKPSPEKPSDELTPELIEWWKNLLSQVVPYEGGICRDGKTTYPAGRRLLIGYPGQAQQVMDTFELPWVQETVKEMWRGRGAQDVGERGFGLGLMSEEIHSKMMIAQKAQLDKLAPVKPQLHVIAELNKSVFENNAKGWAMKKLEQAKQEGRPLRIVFVDDKRNEKLHENLTKDQDLNALVEVRIINGDADEVMLKFPNSRFDLMFSDTHQLARQFLGIHDILKLNQLKLKLRRNGKFTFLAWHRENQTGDVDPKQRRRINHDFINYYVSTPEAAKVIIPRDCQYLEGSELILPVVICRNPRLN